MNTDGAAHRLITFRPQDGLDRLFAVSVAIKGLDGLLELLGGLALLLLTPEKVEAIAAAFAHSVLGAVLPDAVSGWAIAGAERLTSSGLAFGAAYLLAHGVLKVFLVAALLRNKLWAYPWMVAVLVGFVAYQSVAFVHAPSLGLAVLTLFDVAVIALTWREYRHQRRQRRAREQPPSTGPHDAAQIQLSVHTSS